MIKTKSLFLSIVFLILVFALFFGFRTAAIYKTPIFADEAIYVRWSQVMRSEASLRFLPMSDGKQPLFMWLTMPMFKLIDDPLVAARTLSTLAGFGSALGLSVLAFLLFGSLEVAIYSLLAYTILPFAVYFDRLALADSLLAMFGIWTLVFGYLFAKSKRFDFAILTGFFLGLGLLTKSPAIFYYIWVGLSLVFFIDFSELKKPKAFLSLLGGLVTILVVSQMLLGILKLGPNSNMASSRNQDYLYSFSEVSKHVLTPLIPNLKTTLNWLWLLVSPTFLLALLFIKKTKENRNSIFFLLLISLVPLIAQALIAKVYTSRYILFAITPLIPLIALGIKNLKLYSKVLVFIPPLYLSLLYTFEPAKSPLPYDMSSGYYQEWTAGWGQKEIANYLKERAKNLPTSRQVVVFTEGFFGTLPDGLQIYTEGISNITIVGSSPIATKLPDGLTNTSLENERFFVINKSRNKLPESELQKLELIEEYPKFSRADGTQEFLQFYKLK